MTEYWVEVDEQLAVQSRLRATRLTTGQSQVLTYHT